MNLLFLHGYTQSGPLFSAKTKAVQKALQKALGPSTTLSFPTAPHRLRPADIPFSTPAEGADVAEPTEAYGWWVRSNTSDEFLGLSETFAFLSSYLDTHGPFDGVVGFSQGAAMAAILASALEPGRERLPEFTTTHPALQFAACYSGFRAPGRYERWYTPLIATATLHVIGSLDTVVEESRSLALARACVGGEKHTVYHPGGHYLPAQKGVVAVLVGFIRSTVEEKKKKQQEVVGVEDMEFPF